MSEKITILSQHENITVLVNGENISVTFIKGKAEVDKEVANELLKIKDFQEAGKPKSDVEQPKHDKLPGEESSPKPEKKGKKQ